MTDSQYNLYSTTKDAWQAMLEAIKHAQRSIYWEVYIFLDDDAGNQFFDELEAKAKAGVDVKLLIDYWGSFSLSRKRMQSMRASGIDVQFFAERKKWYRGFFKSLITRTHRKVLIVDEAIGFVGGVNIRKEMEDWLDLHVKIEGKVVHSLLRAFAKNYVISGGERAKVKHLLSYKSRVASDEIEFVFDEAYQQKSLAKQKYIDALMKARERIILLSPYYYPGKDFFKQLWLARKRGVKVDLLIPFRSDLRLANYVAYGFFSLMHKAGVTIYLTKRMMHGKGVIVDDEWAMIGSSNLDKTSFDTNYEANVAFKNKKLIQNFKNTVQSWMKDAMPFDGINWEKRGRIQRLKERFARKLYKIFHGE